MKNTRGIQLFIVLAIFTSFLHARGPVGNHPGTRSNFGGGSSRSVPTGTRSRNFGGGYYGRGGNGAGAAFAGGVVAGTIIGAESANADNSDYYYGSQPGYYDRPLNLIDTDDANSEDEDNE